jgi:hypothetical protein
MQRINEMTSFTPIPELREPKNFVYLSNIRLINKNREENSLGQPSYTTTGTISQLRELPPVWLASIGEQLAIWLAEVLDQLKRYNEEAIDPIVSVLEPYLETDRDLDFSITLRPSRKFVATVTRREEPEPELYLD